MKIELRDTGGRVKKGDIKEFKLISKSIFFKKDGQETFNTFPICNIKSLLIKD